MFSGEGDDLAHTSHFDLHHWILYTGVNSRRTCYNEFAHVYHFYWSFSHENTIIICAKFTNNRNFFSKKFYLIYYMIHIPNL